VSGFLTEAWFNDTNVRLARAGADGGLGPRGRRSLRVVFEVNGGLSNLPHALTFAIGPDGASVSPGAGDAADLVINVGFADGAALAAGTLDATTALSEGRMKVRGDVAGLVELSGWLAAVHRASLEERS
jgi:hypothetical protein